MAGNPFSGDGLIGLGEMGISGPFSDALQFEKHEDMDLGELCEFVRSVHEAMVECMDGMSEEDTEIVLGVLTATTGLLSTLSAAACITGHSGTINAILAIALHAAKDVKPLECLCEKGVLHTANTVLPIFYMVTCAFHLNHMRYIYKEIHAIGEETKLFHEVYLGKLQGLHRDCQVAVADLTQFLDEVGYNNNRHTFALKLEEVVYRLQLYDSAVQESENKLNELRLKCKKAKSSLIRNLVSGFANLTFSVTIGAIITFGSGGVTLPMLVGAVVGGVTGVVQITFSAVMYNKLKEHMAVLNDEQLNLALERHKNNLKGLQLQVIRICEDKQREIQTDLQNQDLQMQNIMLQQQIEELKRQMNHSGSGSGSDH